MFRRSRFPIANLLDSSMSKPLLAITQGDPTGIGPEIIAAAWRQPAIHDMCRAIFVGHPEIMRRAVALLETDVAVVTINTAPDDAAFSKIESSPGIIPCLACGSDDVLKAPAAKMDARGGQAAYDALVTAARLAIDRHVDGIVTAPLHKAALWQAGHHYPGHTELLAELCGVNDFAMMLYLKRDGVQTKSQCAGIGVVHVTLHMALAEVFKHLSTGAIVSKARLIDKTMTVINGVPPRIGVCALNPHAGEEGLFGDEERRIIAPAVVEAKKAGLTIEGPLPADTLMVRARDGDFDAIVAMYHDQGHIAIKLLGMHRAVNVTLGLPIVRTSVAHGTAFDLAWKGRAETSGMVEAIRVATKLAEKQFVN
jgi:4-hydroxythreonine-4-phosphate dehydrogenase